MSIPAALVEGLSSEDRDAVAGLEAVDAVDLLASREKSAPQEERVVVLRNLRVLAGQQVRARSAAGPDGPALAGPGAVEIDYTAEGVPVVDRAGLTLASLSEGLRQRGCLLVKAVITRDRAEEMAAAIDRTLALADDESRPRGEFLAPAPRIAGHQIRPVTRFWTRREGGSLTVDSPRILEEVIDDYRRAGIVDVATEFVRERPALAAEKCYVRRFPGEGISDTGWHQDGAFIGSSRVLNGWLTFDDCGRFAPGMELFLRRFEEIFENDGESQFTWSLSDKQVRDMESRPGEIVVPEFEAGDCLLFDHLLVHRTYRGPESVKDRRSAETWFFAPSTMKDDYLPVLV